MGGNLGLNWKCRYYHPRRRELCDRLRWPFDRNPNYIVVRSPANAGEIIGLIEAMRLRVRERFHVDVERQINIW